ncbi:hypothetical protein HK100_010985 [Physocladia obscura]|uniref:P-type domain-containing protein n=1 Tax=Physocladia obscura TaxID=109957 RepID=A0AAD5T4K0_9FUNG|nr:hypothetical protein HK100_010985 [Physocladia obscura]
MVLDILRTVFVLASAFLAANAAPAAGPRSVFAHFMVDNAASYSQSNWASDMLLAQQAGIDGFALNIPSSSPNTAVQLPLAYAAAQSVGFSLFLSFDFDGEGPFTESQLVSILQSVSSLPAQFLVNGLPFVSTFEGPAQASLWAAVRQTVPLFLVPDWGSLGPAGVTTNLAIIDGAFQWGTWPTGATNMNTDLDSAYIDALGSKPYMMPVSPWFYTNLPSLGKNWLWRGDDLWFDRWQEVIQLQPAFVEIISWNDYGESHYVGPIVEAGIYPGAQTYVDNMPHQDFLDLLPYFISAYKNNGVYPTITQDKLHFWHRLSPAADGGNGGTTGNDGAYQTTVDPNSIVQDEIFVTVLLTSGASVNVYIGSSLVSTQTYSSSGAYHFSVPFSNGQLGVVTVNIVRSGITTVSVTGAQSITDSPANGLTNYNAYVAGSGLGTSTTTATTATTSSTTTATVAASCASTISGPQRIDCGTTSTTQVSCVTSGCCWNVLSGYPNCYYSSLVIGPATCGTTPLAASSRINCGTSASTSSSCVSSGCCWSPLSGSSYCYQPVSTTTTTTIPTTTTTTITTTTTTSAPASGNGTPSNSNGFTFSAAGLIEWAEACDWTGGDIANELTTGELCGSTCEGYSGCTRFTWTEYNGGTCWLKNNSATGPISNSGTGTVCDDQVDITLSTGGFWFSGQKHADRIAVEAIEKGKVDAVAFGALFLVNPDLSVRFEKVKELNTPNVATYYSDGALGYTDCPALN